jgi:hypothetical protein
MSLDAGSGKLPTKAWEGVGIIKQTGPMWVQAPAGAGTNWAKAGAGAPQRAADAIDLQPVTGFGAEIVLTVNGHWG